MKNVLLVLAATLFVVGCNKDEKSTEETKVDVVTADGVTQSQDSTATVVDSVVAEDVAVSATPDVAATPEDTTVTK